MKNPVERGTCYLGTREYKVVYHSTEKRPNTLYQDNETIPCEFLIHYKNLVIEVWEQQEQKLFKHSQERATRAVWSHRGMKKIISEDSFSQANQQAILCGCRLDLYDLVTIHLVSNVGILYVKLFYKH